MRRTISVILTICMLLTTVGITAFAAGDATIFVKPSDFSGNLGTWQVLPAESGSFGEIIKAPGDSKPETAKSAFATIKITQEGEYNVWTRVRDFNGGVNADGSTVTTGTRTCRLAINGTDMGKELGAHGENGWKWEQAGTVKLSSGETTLELIDSKNYYARVEGIILTTDKNPTLPETAEAMKDAIAKYPAEVVGGATTPTTAPSTAPTAAPSGNANLDFKADKYYMVLTPDSFAANMGAWTLSDDVKDSKFPQILMGGTGGTDSSSQPAVAKMGFPESGIYKVMVHSRDFATSPGARPFKVKIGDGAAETYGAHGTDGWLWEESAATPYFKGEVDLQLIDFKGNYARLDLIVVTNDLDFKITDSADNYNALAAKAYVPGTVTGSDDVVDPDRPDTEIAVKLNGSYMTFDVDPVLENDRTLVPFRAIFEALGCTVDWNDETQTAMGTRNGKTIKLPVGSTTAKINGTGVTLDQPAILKDDRTLVPLRFVSEALGANVNWSDATQTVTILASIPDAIYLFNSGSFQEIGTWTLESNLKDSFDGSAMRGTIPDAANATPEDANASNTKPAISTFEVAKAGTYKLWVHAKDFAENQQGSRFFNVGVNGTMLDQKFGTHGETGFRWATGGTVELKEGTNTLELYDTSGFYARTDYIMLTEDLDYTPTESFEGLMAMAAPFDSMGDVDIEFPRYAIEDGEVTDSTEMENDQTKVIFYKVQTSKGQVIQNEIYAKDNGEWVRTKNRNEELGYLIMNADSANVPTGGQDLYVFSTQKDVNGAKKSYMGTDMYKAGVPTWMVPVDYEVTDNMVTLQFGDNDTADFSAVWELQADNKAPLVNVNATFKNDGYYTIGAWEGSEMSYDKFDFALAPYRVQGKRVHEERGLMTEQHLFTPMGTYTLTDDNQYAPGKKITKGVAVEASWIPLRWVYNNNGVYGINMRGTANNYRGAVFAPVMGSEESNLKAGESFNLQYRVISTIGDWFDTYKFVTQDLFGVHDYRQNVYASLNEAIFNTRKLMMDDVYGGWDPYDKAHYNMEGKNATSSANPMEALQVYLLTEDEDVLTRRAIPTIANTLTRKEIHFNRTPEWGGVEYWAAENLPKDIGSPITGFNLNVIGGMYEMTRGGIPFLYDYGLQKGKSTVTNSYGSVAPFSNNLNLYKYTGDKAYLDKAIEQADKYLEDVVYAPQENMVDWSSFIYISYYPNLASLIDLYEVTLEQKYLDAAEFVGQWLATCLWVPGIDGDKLTQKVEVNNLEHMQSVFHYGREDNAQFWWAGDKQFRVGTPVNDPGNPANRGNITSQQEEVEAWIPARVGLGIEQASTYGKSSNIIMSSWVGDFLKLSEYTGESYFADAARNAIVGHFSNYSGYYQNAFTTYQQKADYPYEGPDYSGIYWHHIPPFLAMLEDFLINMTATWSDNNIYFPSLRQQGYAYFNSNQYGFAPGKFYDEEGMWLWLDEGVVDTGNLQIDWLGTKKDGVFGLAMMNESGEDLTTTVTLLDKVPGGADYTGKAALYDRSSGSIGEVDINGGKFEITIPAKSLRAVKILLPEIKAPAYSKMTYDLDGEVDLKETVSTHTNGKGYVLQMSPDNYYAYVYVTDKPASLKNLTMKYKIGNGAEQTVSTDVYPYEFIIKVDDPNAAFTYTLEGDATAGGKTNFGGGTLKSILDPTAKSNPGGQSSEPSTPSNPSTPSTGTSKLEFEPFKVNLTNTGTMEGVLRFVVKTDNFPFEVTDNLLNGCRLKGTFTDENGTHEVDVVLTANEKRDGSTVLVFPVPSNLESKVYFPTASDLTLSAK